METPEIITETLPNGVPLELVKVEGGPFRHGITIPSFYMGKYPVTNEQFLPFLQEMGNHMEGGRTWINLEGSYKGSRFGIETEHGMFQCVRGLEQHPMIYVSWFGARAYGAWLSEKTGQNYSLPSETKWEYAAGGGKHKENFEFAGSNKLKEVGWYRGNSHDETKPIGLKQPNSLGLFDMCGNVDEWCADLWHENYKSAPKDGNAMIRGGYEDGRVVRGGSWYDDDKYCRALTRSGDFGLDGTSNFGFRLCRSY